MGGSITTRLIALLTLCAALIIGLGMALDYRLSRADMLERLDSESSERIKAVVGDIENWLAGIEAATGFLGRVLEQRDYSDQGLKQMLRDLVQHNREIYGAAIALNPALTPAEAGFAPYFYHSDTGIAFANLAETGDYPQQAWFSAPVEAGTSQWSEPYFDRGGGEALMVTYSVPVYRFDTDGLRTLYAVVTADVLVADLHRVLQQLHLGEHSHGMLLSAEGLLLSSRRDADLLRHYSEVSVPRENLDAWQHMLVRVRAGDSVNREIECIDVVGRCTLRMRALRSTGWPIGIVYSQREVLRPLYRFQLKTALISTLTLLGMALAVYLVTHRITRPLVTLSAASASIARGDMDSPLPRARGDDEIATLVRSFSSMSRDLKSYIADLEAATASRSRLEGELAAARDIQMSMLPGSGEALLQEDGVDLWARVQPAKTVGGDLYSYFRGDNHLFLAVGDVSDKGVPAALFMARAISLIQQLSGTATPPHQAMAELNNALERDNHNCMFVTLFLGVLDIPSGRLHFASAGHTAPSLLRRGGVTVIGQDTGPALGLAPDQSYPDNLLQLLPGDRLAIYTDGIDEAFNEEGEMFGVGRFNLELLQCADQDIATAGATLFNSVAHHRGSRAQSDDITLLLLQYPPTSTPPARRHFHLGSGLTGRVQAWMERVLQAWDIPATCSLELQLVAEEMVSNVHKYARLPAEDEIELQLQLREHTVALQVKDPGVAFNPLEEAARAELGSDTQSAEIGGLGVHLITGLTARQYYQRDGEYNVLLIEKDLPEWT